VAATALRRARCLAFFAALAVVVVQHDAECSVADSDEDDGGE
jgi:hypothetical protein